jgi:hypothetical protein
MAGFGCFGQRTDDSRDRQLHAAGARRGEIPIEEATPVWRKDPDYVRAYETLEDEFARATAQDHAGAKRKQGADRLMSKPLSAAFLAALLLATAAHAQPRHHDHRPLKIVIETVDHQRYRTAGDWQIKPDGLHITVSRMSEPALRVPDRHA